MKKFNEFKNINEHNSVLKDDIWYLPIPQREFQIKISSKLIDDILKKIKEKTGKDYRRSWSTQEFIEEIFTHYIINKLEKVNDEFLNYDNDNDNDNLIEEISKIFI